jgi:ubiquinone/menaquinone biosynthesis C-methylase UbiE
MNKTVGVEWAKEIGRQLDSNQYPKWPHEVMVKIIFGGENYLEPPVFPQKEWKILDIGCLFANNLLPFSELGCDCYGIDLHPEVIEVTKKVANQRRINAEFAVGSNTSIPYPDGYFDLLLSIGTIHYEGSREGVDRALEEFYRVLKPGGACFITSTAPKHDFFKRAASLGDNRYKMSNFDFRDDEIFFFFEEEEYFSKCLSRYFSTVSVGRVTEKLIAASFDAFFAVCKR